MEEQNLEKTKHLKNNQIIIIFLVAIIIVISIVFIKQILYIKSLNTDLQNKNADLENEITLLDKQIQSEKESIEKSSNERIQKDIDEKDNIISSKMTGWNTYYDSTNKYTIKYPNNWINIQGDNNGNKYFSNENVYAPLEMDSNGIWINIDVIDNIDNLTLSDWLLRKKIYKGTKILNIENININGIQAIQRIQDATKVEDTEGTYGMYTYFVNNNKIYSISGFSFTKEGFDKHLEEYKFMVNSFIIEN